MLPPSVGPRTENRTGYREVKDTSPWSSILRGLQRPSRVSSPCRQKHVNSDRRLPARPSSRGIDAETRQTRVAIGIATVHRVVEALIVELLGQGPTRS